MAKKAKSNRRVSLDECKNLVLESLGKDMSPQQIEEIMKSVENRLNNVNEERLTDAESLINSGIDDLANETDRVALIVKRNGYLAVRAVERLAKFARTYGSAAKGLLAFLENSKRGVEGSSAGVDAVISGWKSKYLGALKKRLLEEDLLHDFQHNLHVEDIYKEFYEPGSTGNSKAASIRNIMVALKQDAIESSNMYGSWINFRPEHVTKQSYSTRLIKKNFGPARFGTKLNFKQDLTPDEFNQTYNKWREWIMPKLDNELTFKDGDPELILRGAFEGIMTGKHGGLEKADGSEINTRFFKAGSLAKKTSVERLLHYKDGAGAFEAYNLLNPQPLSKGFIEELERSAVNIGLMQQLGPNPAGTLDAVIDELEFLYKSKHYDAKKGTWVDGADEKQVRELQNSRNKITGALGYLDRSALIPHNPTIASVTATVISGLTQAKLGRLLFFAIPDRALMHSALTANGVGGMDALRASLRITKPSNVQDRLRLVSMGAELKSFASQMHSRFTTGAEGSLPSIVGTSQKYFFDLTGIHYLDDIGTGAVVESMSRNAGLHANLSFANIPYSMKSAFKAYGIDEVTWDAWRSAAYHIDSEGDIAKGWSGKQVEEGGVDNWITPDRFTDISTEHLDQYLKSRKWAVSAQNRGRARVELESKYHTWLSSVRDEAVLTPGSREHRLATWGTRPGHVSTSAIRLLMMFKSFPITVYTRIIEREMFQRGATGVVDWMKLESKSNFHTTQLVAMSILAGYLSLTLDELLQGKNPRKITKEDGSFDTGGAANLLKDSFLRGGVGGIYADMLMRKYDEGYNNLVKVIGGPAVGSASGLVANAYGTGSGEKGLDDWVNYAYKHTPYINLFYVRPAIDYLIMFNLHEFLAPGEQSQVFDRREQELNQTYWMRP